MTTFTMQDLNNTEVTKEEEEAMQALEKVGVDLVGFNTPIQMGEPLPNQTPDISTIINNICTQLQLLSTVIKEGAGKGNSLNAEGQNDNQSLQECVSAVLENSDWFKEMVEEAVSERVEGYLDDRDFDQEVVSAVEYYFSESFRLDDHVDIEHVVEDRLNHATITVQF